MAGPHTGRDEVANFNYYARKSLAEDNNVSVIAGEADIGAIRPSGENNKGGPSSRQQDSLDLPLLNPIAVHLLNASESASENQIHSSSSSSVIQPERLQPPKHTDTAQQIRTGAYLKHSESNYAVKASGENFKGSQSPEFEMHTYARKGLSPPLPLSPLSPLARTSESADQPSAKLLDGPFSHELDHAPVNEVQDRVPTIAKVWNLKLGRTIFYIIMWYLFSLCLSLYNKFLLGTKHGHFPAPLLMTTLHFSMQFCIATFLLRCVVPAWRSSKLLSWKDYLLRVVPTAVATAADIGLSNLALAVITLTFYTMCKASAPVFLLLFAFAFALESASLKLLGVILVISIGVLLTVAGETEFDMVGFMLVMFASVMSGLRWVLIQVLLQKEKLGMTNPLATLAALTPVMSMVCLTLSLILEPWHELHQSTYFATWRDCVNSLGIMFLGGIVAFFMIMTEFLLISETSAVTFSVAGTVKEGFTIIISHFVFNDRFTSWNTAGLAIMVVGVSLFNVYKLQRMKEGKVAVHHSPTQHDADLSGELEERALLVDVVVESQASNQEPRTKESPGSGPHAPMLGIRLKNTSTPSPRASASPRALGSPRIMSPRAVGILKEGELLGGSGALYADDNPWKSPRGLSSPGSAGLHERRVDDKIGARIGE